MKYSKMPVSLNPVTSFFNAIAVFLIAIFAIGMILMVNVKWANAADLMAVEAPEVPSVESAATFDWTGFYVGAAGGYGWGSVHDKNNPAATKKDIDGWLGGANIGYNWQFSNNVVLGLEADAFGGDVGKKWGGENAFDPYYGEDKINAYGTARVRVGYAVDRFLPYITGGLAWANFDHALGCDANRVVATNGCQNKRGGSAFYTSKSDTDIGWVVGVGAEYAVTDHVIAGIEYQYADFGKHKTDLFDPNYPAAISERQFDSSLQTVKATVKWKF